MKPKSELNDEREREREEGGEGWGKSLVSELLLGTTDLFMSMLPMLLWQAIKAGSEMTHLDMLYTPSLDFKQLEI